MAREEIPGPIMRAIDDLFSVARLFGPIGTLAIILGGVSLVFVQDIASLISVFFDFPFESDREMELIITLNGVILLGIGLAFAASGYLRGGSYKSGASDRINRYSGSAEVDLGPIMRELNSQREILEAAISNSGGGTAPPIAEDDRRRLFATIAERIDKELGQTFFREIDEKYGSAIRKTSAYKVLKEEYEKTRSRLSVELGNLSRRGNLNLVIGIFISFSGIIFLGWSVFNAPALQAADRDLIAYYIPRTTFVVLIEIFAFFFLNLYRASLNEIKYFQNELTNVEARILGLESIIASDDMKALAELAKDLIKTERNFILNKGQTTVELEKEKAAGNLMKDNLNALSQLLKTTKSD